MTYEGKKVEDRNGGKKVEHRSEGKEGEFDGDKGYCRY
jgi:hypothetical protein